MRATTKEKAKTRAKERKAHPKVRVTKERAKAKAKALLRREKEKVAARVKRKEKASLKDLALCVANLATELRSVGNVANKFNKLKGMIREIMEEMEGNLLDLPRGLHRLQQVQHRAAPRTEALAR